MSEHSPLPASMQFQMNQIAQTFDQVLTNVLMQYFGETDIEKLKMLAQTRCYLKEYVAERLNEVKREILVIDGIEIGEIRSGWEQMSAISNKVTWKTQFVLYEAKQKETSSRG